MGWKVAVPFVLLTCAGGCSTDPPWDPPDEIREQLQGIIGGLQTDAWPAVGAYSIDGGWAGMCTAVLVAPDMVLTAAHCAADSGDADRFVMAPDLDDANLSDVHRVAEVMVHPQYNGHGKHPHDVALLRLVEDVEDVDFIPVNALDLDSDWPGTWLHYVGYGANTFFGGPGAGLKRETDLQVAWLTSHEFSTYAMDTNYCSGDSGGPGFVEIDGRWYVAAVVSSVYALDDSEDMCAGGGWSMRVDAETWFLDEHYDTGLEPDNWYQPPGSDVGDDDDSAAADDDDSAAADDDTDDDVSDDDGEGDGCQCLSAGQRPASGGLVALLLLLGITRRKSAR